MIGQSELGEVERIHPRTPGSLLLLRPLAELSVESAYPAMIILISLSTLGAVLFVLPQLRWQAAEVVVLLLTVLMAGSAAYLGTLRYATHSGFLMLCIGVGFLLLRRQNEVGVGLAQVGEFMRVLIRRCASYNRGTRTPERHANVSF